MKDILIFKKAYVHCTNFQDTVWQIQTCAVFYEKAKTKLGHFL